MPLEALRLTAYNKKRNFDNELGFCPLGSRLIPEHVFLQFLQIAEVWKLLSA